MIIIYVGLYMKNQYITCSCQGIVDKALFFNQPGAYRATKVFHNVIGSRGLMRRLLFLALYRVPDDAGQDEILGKFDHVSWLNNEMSSQCTQKWRCSFIIIDCYNVGKRRNSSFMSWAKKIRKKKRSWSLFLLLGGNFGKGIHNKQTVYSNYLQKKGKQWATRSSWTITNRFAHHSEALWSAALFGILSRVIWYTRECFIFLYRSCYMMRWCIKKCYGK